MERSIFVNDLTAIDFSIITSDGRIVGGSATLNVELSTTSDAINLFSQAEQIKGLINGPGGFDHRCWINVDDTQVILDLAEHVTTVSHRSSGLSITAGSDSFAFVSNQPEVDIAEFLNASLESTVATKITLNSNMIPVIRSNCESNVFRFVRGLKDSESYGEQNIVHGHRSFISAVTNEDLPEQFANLVLRGIATDLDGTIFAQADDLKATAGGVYTVGYSTDIRGPATMQFMQKLIVLETPPTIENIVEYIRARYYDQLKGMGVRELFVSEGLYKGVQVTI